MTSQSYRFHNSHFLIIRFMELGHTTRDWIWSLEREESLPWHATSMLHGRPWKYASDVHSDFVQCLLDHPDIFSSQSSRDCTTSQLYEVRSRHLHHFCIVKVRLHRLRFLNSALTPLSFRADDYNVTQSNSDFKAMLVAKVVLGNGYPMFRTNKTLKSPPYQWDSVCHIWIRQTEQQT